MIKSAASARNVARGISLMLVAMAAGCVPVFTFTGSDFHFEWEPLIQRAEYQEVRLKFRGYLTSSRDMRTAIGDALGYPLNNDTTMQNVAKDFLAPAGDILTRYGMPVKVGLPTARVTERRFDFATDWTPEVTPILRDGHSVCAVMRTDDPCTFESQLSNGYAEFNPLLPKQIKIEAILRLRIRLKRNSRIVAPGPLQTARMEVFLERGISDALKTEYTNYFRDRYHLDVAVRGF